MSLTFRVPKELTFEKAKPLGTSNGKKKKRKDPSSSQSSSSSESSKSLLKRSKNVVNNQNKFSDNYQTEEHFESPFTEQVKVTSQLNLFQITN